MVADGSKSEAKSVGVDISTVSRVGMLVSVMMGGGSLILFSAKVVERPPKINNNESVPKRMLPPS